MVFWNQWDNRWHICAKTSNISNEQLEISMLLKAPFLSAMQNYIKQLFKQKLIVIYLGAIKIFNV